MVDIKVKGNGKANVIITAIICITIIELFALYMGFNGIILTAVIAAIAGLAGVIIPTPKILGGK